MSHRHMNHVTIEDVEDEDNLHQQQYSQQNSATEIDLDNIAGNQTQSISNGYDVREIEDHQGWDEVDALEEQARSEKLRDQHTARKLANQTAHVVDGTA